MRNGQPRKYKTPGRKKAEEPVKQRNGLLAALLGSLTVHALLLVLLAGGFSLSLPNCGKGSGGEEQAQAEAKAKEEQERLAEEERLKQPMMVELGDILPPPAKESAPTEEPQPLDEDGLMQKVHNDQPCPDFFGGIGVEYSTGIDRETDEVRYVVNKVVPGYPAERHGIMAGDVPIGDFQKIRGEVGTPVLVRVMRDGKILEFSMTREKICISKRQKAEKDARDALDRLHSLPRDEE